MSSTGAPLSGAPRAGPARTRRGARDLDVTVDVVLLTVRAGQLAVLLVEREHAPFAGSWALPGGPVRDDEALGHAAARQLAARTGPLPGTAADVHLEQLRTYGDPGRDPRGRVVSTAYLGLGPDLPAPADPARARFWPVSDLDLPGTAGPSTAEGPPLAFDHGAIVADGIERARSKLEYTALATAFVEEPFSLADLRRVYEAVWGAPVDPANFRRKVLSTSEFVAPVGDRAAPGPVGGRPARLYRRGASLVLHPAMLRPESPGGAPGTAGPAWTA